MRRVEWSEKAEADIRAQVIHIATDNPQAARRMVVRIQQTGAALGDFATGRHPVRVDGVDENRYVARLYPRPVSLPMRSPMTTNHIHSPRRSHSRDWPDGGCPG